MFEPDIGDYRRPHTLLGVLTQLSARPGSVLAGGTDLVLMRSDGMVDPAHDIVDIKGVEALRGINREADGAVSVGAATSLRDLATTRAFAANAITDGAALVGGWQTRARGTIGGNVCRASPAGDTLPGILVADAVLELASSSGMRLVPGRSFFTGPGRTVRRPDELLTRIIIPASTGRSAYLRFTYRLAMDLAVVGVAAHLEIEDGQCTAARIALSAAAATPISAPEAAQALVGSQLDERAIDTAAQLVLESASPIDDGRGSRIHRRAVLPVLAKRVIEVAVARSLGGQGR